MKNLALRIKRFRLASKIRRTEADIRRTLADADRYPDRATYYRGEVLPALALQVANLHEQRRRLMAGPMPILANMPVLGQPSRPVLHIVRP